MFLLTEAQQYALQQILTTILTSENSELKSLIVENNLISAIHKDVEREIIRRDVEHVIMMYDIPGIDIKKDDKLIDKTVDHIIENYDYSDYNDYIADYLRKQKGRVK